MNDQSCVEFLQWCLLKLDFRWQGFKKVRKQVCKRIQRRVSELGISDLISYRNYLEKNPGEWNYLDSMCFITISRFYRDKAVFNSIQNEIFPLLTRNVIGENKNEIRCWSAGCCSGEEPYTLKILWDRFIDNHSEENITLHILATDFRSYLIERAKSGFYHKGTLKELPKELIEQAFIKYEDGFKLKDHIKTNVKFLVQDIRNQLPYGEFHLVLFRNLVFTYFSEPLQIEILKNVVEKLKPCGFLIIGAHERLPVEINEIVKYKKNNCIYQKIGK